MSKKCQITSKGRLKGHKVSHANNKTIRVTNANLKSKRIFDSVTGTWVRLKVSARALRTINKKGLHTVLKEISS